MLKSKLLGPHRLRIHTRGRIVECLERTDCRPASAVIQLFDAAEHLDQVGEHLPAERAVSLTRLRGAASQRRRQICRNSGYPIITKAGNCVDQLQLAAGSPRCRLGNQGMDVEQLSCNLD